MYSRAEYCVHDTSSIGWAPGAQEIWSRPLTPPYCIVCFETWPALACELCGTPYCSDSCREHDRRLHALVCSVVDNSGGGVAKDSTFASGGLYWKETVLASASHFGCKLIGEVFGAIDFSILEPFYRREDLNSRVEGKERFSFRDLKIAVMCMSARIVNAGRMPLLPRLVPSDMDPLFFFENVWKVVVLLVYLLVLLTAIIYACIKYRLRCGFGILGIGILKNLSGLRALWKYAFWELQRWCLTF